MFIHMALSHLERVGIEPTTFSLPFTVLRGSMSKPRWPEEFENYLRNNKRHIQAGLIAI
jgi:hypothetical protein